MITNLAAKHRLQIPTNHNDNGKSLQLIHSSTVHSNLALHLTGRFLHQAENGRTKGRFARADLSHNSHQTPLWDINVDIPQTRCISRFSVPGEGSIGDLQTPSE